MNIKNNIAILVSHIWRGYKIINKTVYYAMNVTSTKVKLFAIRHGINQVSFIPTTLYYYI